jgi:hypothetical protein
MTQNIKAVIITSQPSFEGYYLRYMCTLRPRGSNV